MRQKREHAGTCVNRHCKIVLDSNKPIPVLGELKVWWGGAMAKRMCQDNGDGCLQEWGGCWVSRERGIFSAG